MFLKDYSAMLKIVIFIKIFIFLISNFYEISHFYENFYVNLKKCNLNDIEGLQWSQFIYSTFWFWVISQCCSLSLDYGINQTSELKRTFEQIIGLKSYSIIFSNCPTLSKNIN